jgi:hypothetical protein
MLFIRLTYDFPSPLSKYSYTYKVLKVRALVGRNYHHPFRNFLFTYFIFNKMSVPVNPNISYQGNAYTHATDQENVHLYVYTEF